MTTFRNRLRFSFVAVAVGVVLVAALVIASVGRRATANDARDLAVSVASVGSANIAQLVEARVDGIPDSDIGLRPERRGQRGFQAALGAIARSLNVVGATLIEIDADGNIRDLSLGEPPGLGAQTRTPPPTTREQTNRDSRNLDIAETFADDLTAGRSFTSDERRHVFAGEPVVLGEQVQELLGDDTTLAVVAQRELGRAGLGPLGPGLLLTFVLALIAALSLAEALSRRLRGPLLAVSDTSRAIAAGNLDARVDLPTSTDEEVAQIGETIDALAEQLGQERVQRRQFLQDISHELRTPLTSVRGHAELLADEPTDPVVVSEYTAEVAESGRVIERESLRMERLIEDLLDLARFDTGQMSVTPTEVDVTQSASETVSALRAKADQRDVVIDITEPAGVAMALGDRTRLDQVITNLVGNAIDFASATVEVETTVDADEVVVSVRDDGPGLGPAPEQFFERHRRGAQPADRTAGLGVGLSIVETFVTAMGGTVSAANRAVGDATQTGAIFTVTLPRAGT